jgi:glycosyltransferase involved in cell wall biosynthesis
VHRILFADVTCHKPYDGNTLRTRPQGGSESSVTRVAEALARHGHRVRVTQHNRTERVDAYGVEYTPWKQSDDFTATHLVAFREAEILRVAIKRSPGAKCFVWYQDFPDPSAPFPAQAELLARFRATAVLVSDWHERLWMDYLRAYGYEDRVPTWRIYNAIPDDLGPDATPVDRDKLVFFSSPHKGFRETLDFFSRLKDHPELKGMRLHVANPGYLESGFRPDERLVDLGALPWGEVIREVRSAFLVLHYNDVFPETFGLVHAEADAVGTPWISGRIGANPEVCSHPDEMADLGDPERVIDRIVQWRRHGRIPVRAGEQFRITRIAGEWEDLLRADRDDEADPPAFREGSVSEGETGGENDAVACVVDRADVEAGDTGAAAAFFARLTETRESARAHQGRIDLRFAGYEGDARESGEVPEVRTWIQALDEQVKSWFWCLSARPASDGLLTVMRSLCDPASADAGDDALDPAERAAVLAKHYLRFHKMAEHAAIPLSESVRKTQAVARYYGARLAPAIPA